MVTGSPLLNNCPPLVSQLLELPWVLHPGLEILTETVVAEAKVTTQFLLSPSPAV